ncbi:MAG: hypothetical protein B7Z55_12775 [Planctomycetales bacterium 12-60-4]|nr:MAG: hypothetical protein B7Z55_12775 [Planctomycetales bacterium 12-60-4]
MILRRSAFKLVLSIGGLCVAASGCGVPVADSSSEDATKLDHEHEHGIPDHKPRTFTRAVAELSTRLQHIEQAAAEASVPQLRDIVDWLPELAADTDLNEADWNMVQQTSHELDAIVRRWPDTQALPSAFDRQAYRRLVERLQPLAAAARDDNGPVAADDAVVLQ